MSKIKRLLLVIVILSLPQLILSQARQSTKQPLSGDILERRVPGDDLEYLTTTNAFRAALAGAGATGGIASVATGCEDDPIVQRWMPVGASLKSVLDWIVAADPGYRWGSDSGVINLLPKDSEPALLKTRISRFRLDKSTDIDSAVDQLLLLPEVKQRENELHFTTGVKLIVRPSSKNDPKITLDCENMTVLEALNAIVRAYGRAVWLYRERHCAGKTIYRVDIIVR
jgi:hypothetical protein